MHEQSVYIKCNIGLLSKKAVGLFLPYACSRSPKITLFTGLQAWKTKEMVCIWSPAHDN
jgi:hypothetical protein